MITSSEDKKVPVLLLGGSGRLGQMLRHFWPQPHDLVGQSRQGGPNLLALDLLQNRTAAVAAMQNKRAAICLSGVTPAYAAQNGTPFSLNVDLALAAIEAAAIAEVPRLFLASSAAIYGSGPGPFHEDDMPQPISEYGQEKARMEEEGLKLAAKLGVAVTILRIGNVAGADAILGNWRFGMQIDQLKGGSSPKRSYIGPQTLATACHQLCGFAKLPTILNIAAPGTVAMGALLDAAGLGWGARPAPPDVIETVAFDTQRLEQLVTFAPKDSDPAAMVAQWSEMKAAQ